jgi:hypothetical protein
MAKCQMRSRMSLSSMREKYLKAGGASSVMLESWTLEVLLEGMAGALSMSMAELKEVCGVSPVISTSGELLTSCSIGPSDMGRCSRNILVDSFLLFESRRFRVNIASFSCRRRVQCGDEYIYGGARSPPNAQVARSHVSTCGGGECDASCHSFEAK